MRPYLTILREAIKNRLASIPEIESLVGNRIYINRSEFWGEPELPVAGVYLYHVEPIENDLNPSPDERRASFTVEFIVNTGNLEETLDAVEEITHTIADIGLLDEKIVALGGPKDQILQIDWTESELGYAPEASEILGALVVSLDIEYLQPKEAVESPDFLIAKTKFETTGHEGTAITVEGEVTYDAQS
jgi:hypothetical protein